MEPLQAEESKQLACDNANLENAPSAGLIKAHRDLQRQVSSLTRLQSLRASQITYAKSSIQSAFDKLNHE
jgi:hypothetical protein